MDPALAAPIATIAGSIATAILMWASYNYPRGYHRDQGARRNESRGRHRRDDDDDEGYDEEDEDDADPDPHPHPDPDRRNRIRMKDDDDGRHAR